jgi:hypothetical protein
MRQLKKSGASTAGMIKRGRLRSISQPEECPVVICCLLMRYDLSFHGNSELFVNQELRNDVDQHVFYETDRFLDVSQG